MEKLTSHFWERRGKAIYTEGDFVDGEYVAGSAQLVTDLCHTDIHTNVIDSLVASHNEAIFKATE